MGETLLWAAGIVAGASVAWFLGARWGGGRYREVLLRIARELRVRGDVPADAVTGAPPEIGEFRGSLAEALERRGRDPDAAVREALERVVAFLRTEVRDPLSGALEGDAAELRAAARRARVAVEDLAFFLEEPPRRPPERRNLTELVRTVTREYAGQWDVLVKLQAPHEAVPVRVDPEAFMDALYLVLHNAGQFGGGGPVTVTVDPAGGRPSVLVRDRGPGFDSEALERAYDPFYSTASGGLGLGLPHARRLLHEIGGEIALRNRDEGGAEVEIALAPVG